MKNILNKKVSCPLWAVIAIVAFIVLAIETGNITVSDSFITVVEITTLLIIGSITTITVTKILLDKASLIRDFVIKNINTIIISLVIILIITLVFGIVHQINISAMSIYVLKKIAIAGIIVTSIVLIITIINIIKLDIKYKKAKRRNKMHKLASLITKSSKFIPNSKNIITIKALVTDLYSLSVQDIIVNNNINIKKLYKSEVFLSLLNESTTVTKDLGSFKNSLDFLVSNNYISSLEAATAKVVTFYVDREVLELL